MVQGLFLLIGMGDPLLIDDALQPRHLLHATLGQDTLILHHPMLKLTPLFDVLRNLRIVAREVEKTTRKFDPVHVAGRVFVQRNW